MLFYQLFWHYYRGDLIKLPHSLVKTRATFKNNDYLKDEEAQAINIFDEVSEIMIKPLYLILTDYLSDRIGYLLLPMNQPIEL